MHKTVYPASCNYKEPVTITTENGELQAFFPKNDCFRTLVKSLNFTWSGLCWSRKITKCNGPGRDRVIELGNKLLNAGFPIDMDEALISDAISGNYQPEQKLWIKAFTSGKYKGMLSICWTGYDDSLYQKAKKLPGSRWAGNSMAVKVNYWQEVDDFANLYGFVFSDYAKEVVEKYKKSLQDITVVNPVAVQEPPPIDGLKKILESSADILDDLKEEDYEI